MSQEHQLQVESLTSSGHRVDLLLDLKRGTNSTEQESAIHFQSAERVLRNPVKALDSKIDGSFLSLLSHSPAHRY